MTLISKHGITLNYVQGDAMICDHEAAYVDDLLDCFDSWDGRGSLKEHCLRYFEMDLEASMRLARESPLMATRSDLVEACRTVIEQKIRLLKGEPEDGLVACRRMYIQQPQKTIEKMLRLARSTQRRVISVPG